MTIAYDGHTEGYYDGGSYSDGSYCVAWGGEDHGGHHHHGWIGLVVGRIGRAF